MIQPAIVTTDSGDFSTYIGRGFDHRTRTVLNSVCRQELPLRALNQTDIEIRYIENQEALHKFYSLTASASFDGAQGSVGGSLAIVNTTDIVRSDVFLAIKAKVVVATQTIAEVLLLDDVASELRSIKELPAFIRKYGTHVISKVYHGGDLACVVRVRSKTGESSKSIRQKFSANGWGAKGKVETAEIIRQVSSEYALDLRYSQNGGLQPTGNSTKGITADGMIERLYKFVEEVNLANANEGRVAALGFDPLPLTSAKNWPVELDVDLDRPYPEPIERAAAIVVSLKDRREVYREITTLPMVSEGSRQAAAQLAQFLDDTITVVGAAVTRMKKNKDDTLSVPIETFEQYRVRKHLNVLPNIRHLNAGKSRDATEERASELLEALLGPTDFPPIEPWPKFTRQVAWGVHGEDMPLNGLVHFKCHKNIPDLSPDQFARQLFGVKEGDGHQAFGDLLPQEDVSNWLYSRVKNQTCKYQIAVFINITDVRPDAPLLPKLDLRKFSPSAFPIPTNIRIEEQDEHTRIFFDIAPGARDTIGSYVVDVTEDNKGVSRKRRIESYWIAKDKVDTATIETEIRHDGQWTVQSATPIILQAATLVE